jgi:Putative MetA-pathway of phenol degradation
MRRRYVACAAALTALLLCHTPAAFAQQRPLLTEDPETIGAGRMLIEGGAEWERDVFLPVSGLRGNTFSLVPGVSIGVSSIAEIQFDGGLYQRMDITQRSPAPFSQILTISGDSTSDSDDLSVGAKIRFLSETPGRPGMAFRFSTRLPNASNESGLGTDTQDFTASLIAGKTVQSIRVVFNGGLQIVTDPTQGARQDDLFAFGVSLARAITNAVEVVGEYTGRVHFADIVAPGAENRGAFRFGGRLTHRSVRIDAAVVLGVTPRDPEFGLSAGATWVFNAFKVP